MLALMDNACVLLNMVFSLLILDSTFDRSRTGRIIGSASIPLVMKSFTLEIALLKPVLAAFAMSELVS